jgi:hypothetical protein
LGESYGAGIEAGHEIEHRAGNAEIRTIQAEAARAAPH